MCMTPTNLDVTSPLSNQLKTNKSFEKEKHADKVVSRLYQFEQKKQKKIKDALIQKKKDQKKEHTF